MAKATYTPLYFAQLMDVLSCPENTLTTILRRVISEGDDIMRFLWFDTDFMDSDYNGPYRYLNDFLAKHRSKLYGSFTGSTDIPDNIDEDRALAAEAFSTSYIVNTWAKSKQVYQFDAELELSLADSDNIELPVRILDRLPHRTFYIDFAENGIFKSNFHGTFIHIAPEQKGYLVYIMRVKEDGRSMSGKIALVPQDDNYDEATFIFDKNDIPQNNADRNKDWQIFGFFLINALLYLCADNNEIHESALTKQTYRKSTRIRNKFSEVRKWECGYRYGTEIRKIKTTSDDKKETSSHASPASRKTVIKHVRRAHWHHYWVGKQNTDERKLILHWIPPTLVRGTKCDAAIIHKVN